MVLVGVILGIVGRGYQALNRLNLASYQMSIRLEFIAFLQRLSYETQSALTINTTATTLSFTRIDPTLNLNYNSPAASRLPWPLLAPPTTTGLGLPGDPWNNAANRVTTSYAYNAVAKEVRRTAFGSTTTQIREIGEFLVALESGGRVITVQMRPASFTAPVKMRALLPLIP